MNQPIKAGMAQQTGGQAGQVPLAIEDTDPVICSKEGCESQVFEQAVMLRRLSPLSPKSNGQEQIIPMAIMVCKACGEILQ